MRILFTGADGYIGAVLGPKLLERGHHAVGLDTGLYRREAALVPFVGLVARWLPAPVLVAGAVLAAVALRGVTPHFFDFSLI